MSDEAPDLSDDSAFRARVLEWLRVYGGYRMAAEVKSVETAGSDWEGSTETGFSSSFSVYIKWRDEKDADHLDEIEGTELASLWHHIVGGYEGQPDA